MPLSRMTNDEIEAARTPKGGWTRDQLAKWGVPWPPPKGWRAEITKPPVPQKQPVAAMKISDAALRAFREEELLWALSENNDKSGRRVMIVKRGEEDRGRFYVYQEAIDFMADEALRAAMLAGMRICWKERNGR